MDDDNQVLNLLSIFHFVIAGIAAFFATIPFIYTSSEIFGIVRTVAFDMSPTEVWARVRSPLGWVPFAAIGLILAWVIAGWFFAFAVARLGYFIRKKQRYKYCLIMSGIEALFFPFFPFGTLVGIFTIVLMIRPNVRALFEGEGNAK